MRNYRINEFAAHVGGSVQTIGRWEREGKLSKRSMAVEFFPVDLQSDQQLTKI